MNRRSFFRSLACGVLTAAATIYCPKIVVEPKRTMTLLEWARKVDPNGSVDQMAKILAQTNEILQDVLRDVAIYGEGAYKVTIRNKLPEVRYVRLRYEGIGREFYGVEP